MGRWKVTVRILLVLLAACLLGFTTAEAKKPDNPGGGGGDASDTLEYDIHQLDSAGGAFSGFAADLDDIGTVVGSAVDNATGESFAACWDVVVAADGTVTSNLCLLPGTSNAHATGVNNLGEVVGAEFVGVEQLGLYWPSASADPLPLPPLSGDTDARPRRINDAGIVCGESTILESGSAQDRHPVVWRVTSDSNGNPVVSGPFHLPSVNGTAWDLSEPDADGTVTVAGNAWDGEWEAGVTWRVQPQSDGGIWIDPEPTVLQVGVNAYGVNNTGVVCGDSGRPDWIAMLWTETDQIPLELPRKFSSSVANDLNDSGLVVGGLSRLLGYPYEAGVWAGPDAKPVLLSSFLSRKSPFDGLTDASAINQAGVIVGAGWDGDDDIQQAFIALPK
jgi:uncharacterized membrane protein